MPQTPQSVTVHHHHYGGNNAQPPAPSEGVHRAEGPAASEGIQRESSATRPSTGDGSSKRKKKKDHDDDDDYGMATEPVALNVGILGEKEGLPGLPSKMRHGGPSSSEANMTGGADAMCCPGMLLLGTELVVRTKCLGRGGCVTQPVPTRYDNTVLS